MRPRWVFLDRDGTVNVSPRPHEYVTDPADLRLLPGAGAAVARLNGAGVWVAIVTNQRALARGLMTADGLELVHARLRELLAQHGAHLDGIWVCPHQDGVCDCRKPLPGLLLQAQAAVDGLHFARAAMVGDSDSDIAAGRAVGALTVRLDAAGEPGEADLVAPDLAAAADLLLSR
ncbi:MAG: D-glycero-alpha-D-manno-heptose-1,7-bisphosphate 7-phosphatase [Pseudonocardiaceae bacterium]